MFTNSRSSALRRLLVEFSSDAMNLASLMVSKDKVLEDLSSCGVTAQTIRHDMSATCELHSKNIKGTVLERFIGNSQTKHLVLQAPLGAGPLENRLFLVSALMETTVDHKMLSERMGLRCFLTPVDEEMTVFNTVLKINHFIGAVNPFVMAQASCSEVTLLLDKHFLTREMLLFHPMRIDYTTAISPTQLTAFLSMVAPGRFAYVDLASAEALQLPDKPRTAQYIYMYIYIYNIPRQRS